MLEYSKPPSKPLFLVKESTISSIAWIIGTKINCAILQGSSIKSVSLERFQQEIFS